MATEAPKKPTAKKKPRSVREAIVKVLEGADEPMSAVEIYEQIRKRRLAPGLKGKTPAATVSAQLSVHADQFERVGRGKYKLAG